jgi:Asp-tRNA(Asn)/Glu-tRNA(Gln) amidotransferase A subunit family amidase
LNNTALLSATDMSRKMATGELSSEQIMNGDRSDMKRGVVRGLGQSFSRFNQACRQRDETVVQIENFFQDWDIWLCPVASCPMLPGSGQINSLDLLASIHVRWCVPQASFVAGIKLQERKARCLDWK